MVTMKKIWMGVKKQRLDLRGKETNEREVKKWKREAG